MRSRRPGYRLLLAILALDLVIYWLRPATGELIASQTGSYLVQLLMCMPPIFILLSLIDMWVPRELIIRYMGEKSGSVGTLLTMVLGSASGGPLYNAFPAAATMLNKGASFRNAMIFLGSWSTLKIPMVLFEISVLGPKFGLARVLVNIPGIILIAFLIDLVITSDEKSSIAAQMVFEND